MITSLYVSFMQTQITLCLSHPYQFLPNEVFPLLLHLTDPYVNCYPFLLLFISPNFVHLSTVISLSIIICSCLLPWSKQELFIFGFTLPITIISNSFSNTFYIFHSHKSYKVKSISHLSTFLTMDTFFAFPIFETLSAYLIIHMLVRTW